MSHKKHTIELSKEAYELLQQVKKVFISYTGDKEDDRSDEKVIDILAGGFFEQLSHSQAHEHTEDGCCGGGCGCDDSDCGEKCDDDCGCDCEDGSCEEKPAKTEKKAKK